MIVDLAGTPGNNAAQGTLATVCDFDANVCADVRLELAIIRTAIDQSLEAFALGVIVDNSYGKHWAPDAFLFWHPRIAKRI
jgi:hypothetical protein